MKKKLKIAGVILTILLTGAFLYYKYLAVYHGYTPQTFSREAWSVANPEIRGYMVNDLLNRKLELHGMTQDEVIALLGSPNQGTAVSEMYERRADRNTPEEILAEHGKPAPGKHHTMSYDVGYMGFNPNVPMVFLYHLSIIFLDGIVTEAYVLD
jgi:hypothetical protein